jgi:hypothetical protein
MKKMSKRTMQQQHPPPRINPYFSKKDFSVEAGGASSPSSCGAGLPGVQALDLVCPSFAGHALPSPDASVTTEYVAVCVEDAGSQSPHPDHPPTQLTVGLQLDV